MAAAGIIFIGLMALWMAAGGGWPAPVMAGLGVGALGVAVWAGARLGAADREGAALFTRGPAFAALVLGRLPGRVRDSLGVLAAALGARETAPVFVRLKLRPADAAASAAVVTAIGATPGTVVVDADAASLLAHALCEPDVDVAALQATERAAIGAAGARSA